MPEYKRELSGALELRGENDRLRLQLEFAARALTMRLCVFFPNWNMVSVPTSPLAMSAASYVICIIPVICD